MCFVSSRVLSCDSLVVKWFSCFKGKQRKGGEGGASSANPGDRPEETVLVRKRGGMLAQNPSLKNKGTLSSGPLIDFLYLAGPRNRRVALQQRDRHVHRRVQRRHRTSRDAPYPKVPAPLNPKGQPRRSRALVQLPSNPEPSIGLAAVRRRP